MKAEELARQDFEDAADRLSDLVRGLRFAAGEAIELTQKVRLLNTAEELDRMRCVVRDLEGDEEWLFINDVVR